MILLRSSILAILAGCFTAISAWAADPSGTWTFTAEAPNGRRITSTLVLQWANNQLTGTIDNAAGRTAIQHATFADDRVSFSIERKVRRRTVTLRYSGRLEGDTLTGTIETEGRRKKAITLPWTAKRAT